MITDCPSQILAFTDQYSATLTIPLIFTGNCPVTIEYTLTGATVIAATPGEITGVQFNIGKTTVTYSVTDGSNPVSCIFPVTVLPRITLPSSGTVNNTPGECGYIVSGTEFDPVFGCASLPASYT
ncbi:MAG: hypothetical protein LBM08_04605, partial [Dysgonamonadaceae bacterium]|nr:hypothetical protein [Dysgonamonadaceae bacterium]